MLKITPAKFKVLTLSVTPLEGSDEFKQVRKLDLAVEAKKVTDNSVAVQLDLKLSVGDNFHMSILYEVIFDVADSDDKDFKVSDETLVNTFIQVNAPAIAYPFLRAFVSTITVNCGYAAVILPSVNFQALYNNKKKKSEVASSKIIE